MESLRTAEFTPADRLDWRNWLRKHHQKMQAVWVVCYKVNSGKVNMSWSEAVDEAICFGWIDSTRRSRDEHSFIQLFTKRKPGSGWSAINKEKVERLLRSRKMAKAGLETVAFAKQNGAWNLLDDIEQLIVPMDLQQAFDQEQTAAIQFEKLGRSARKLILVKLSQSKKPETRIRQIQSIINTLLDVKM